MKKTIGLLTLLTAYCLLYPGLTQPMLSLTGFVDKADMVTIGKDIIVESPETPELIDTLAEVLLQNMEVTGTVEAYNKTRSILGTIEELFDNGFALVAFLVALFSIIIPVLKGLMMLFSYFKIDPALSLVLRNASGLISKWSMADVYVVGVFVAYLAANAVQKEGGLLSFNATLGSGFYFFLAYCVLSVLSAQLLQESEKQL